MKTINIRLEISVARWLRNFMKISRDAIPAEGRGEAFDIVIEAVIEAVKRGVKKP